jgi:hypothetical protein
MAWTRGHLGMATWSSIAWQLGLTLLVPSHARDEVLLAQPDEGELVEVLFAQPSVVVLERPTAATVAALRERNSHDGAFDPLATWVAELCRDRSWPALSSDPSRLRVGGRGHVSVGGRRDVSLGPAG